MHATIASILPRRPVPLAGRGGAPRIGEVVHDPIEANLLLLPAADGRHVALVAIDALFGSAELRNGILSALGAAASYVADIVLVASHSHSTPTLDPVKTGLGACDPEHLAFVAETIANAMASALASAGAPDASGTPMRLLRGRSTCELNVVRRRRTLRLSGRPPFASIVTGLLPNRGAATPHGIDLWMARDDAGEVQWVVWNWPCHATSFFHDTQISADFPGAVRAALRRAAGNPQLPVLYLPGFCGDIRADSERSPVAWRRRLATPFARPFADVTAASYDSFCKRVSTAAVAALGSARPAGTLRPDARMARAAVPFVNIMSTPKAGAVGLARLDCGDLCMLFMGAETCSPYYALLADLLPSQALLTGYADVVPLYLPVDRQVAEGGYEVDGFRGSFGLPGRFHDRIQQAFVDGVAALAGNPRNETRHDTGESPPNTATAPAARTSR